MVLPSFKRCAVWCHLAGGGFAALFASSKVSLSLMSSLYNSFWGPGALYHTPRTSTPRCRAARASGRNDEGFLPLMGHGRPGHDRILLHGSSSRSRKAASFFSGSWLPRSSARDGAAAGCWLPSGVVSRLGARPAPRGAASFYRAGKKSAAWHYLFSIILRRHASAPPGGAHGVAGSERVA